MPSFSKLLRRLGYVKLDQYGLVLTPEDRVMATRPTVLDDGLGGKIVGWVEGDLAAMELESWAPMGSKAAKPAPPPLPPIIRPAPKQAVATPVATPPVTQDSPFDEPQTEDDWEWTIAVARARAAADDAEVAAQSSAKVIPISSASRASKPKFVEAKTLPGVAPITQPTAKVIDFAPPTLVDDDEADWAAIRARAERAAKLAPSPVARPAPIAARPAPLPRAGSPKTIIPVPKIIGIAPSAVQPVTRTTAPQPVARARFPKGTGPTTEVALPQEDRTQPSISVHTTPLPRVPRKATSG